MNLASENEQTTSLEPFRRLGETFEALAQTCDDALKGGGSGDDAATRKAVDAGRIWRVRLLIDRAEAEKNKPPADVRASAIMAKIRDAMTRINRAEAFLQAWSMRYMSIPQEELLKTKELRHALADAMIPLVWDWNSDLAVILGGKCEEFVKTLHDRGQKRIVTYIPGEDKDPDLDDDGAITVYREKDLWPCLGLFMRPPTERVAYLRIENGVIKQDEHTAVSEKIEKSLREHRQSWATMNVFGARWVRQGIENLPRIASNPSFGAIGKRFAGKPLVIISPGPSLEKNIHLLKELKGKAILLATAQSVLALKKAGVAPDLVMIVDPQDMRYYFDGYPVEEAEMLMVGVACHPDTYRLPFRRLMSFTANQSIDGWVAQALGDEVCMQTGGSVSLAAFRMALHWRCDPILLVGQDLSFTNNKHYAASTADGNVTFRTSEDGKTVVAENWSKGAADMERQLMKDLGREPAPGPEQGPSQTYVVHTLPGYYGGSVQTNESYSFFHRGFQESARREREKDDGVTLLNCTEGGAFIEGFEHVALSKALQDTLASRPNLDVPQLLDDVYGDGRIDERQQKLQKALTKIWMGLNRCEDAARRCKRGAKDARTNPNKIRSLSRTEAEMITQINQVDFISLVAQAEIDAAVVEGGRARNATESLKASERLYDVVLKATSELKPVVSKAMSELEALMKKQ